MKSNLLAAALAAIILLLGLRSARAQMIPGAPIATVIVVEKPEPGETYANRHLITIGVGESIYTFVLKDAYTNRRSVRWPDIWQQVQGYRPNLQTAGTGTDKLGEIVPGETAEITGLYARPKTFEIVSVEPSGGGVKHY